MRLTDIEAIADRNPFDLSGGQMQRVALASVIVLEPDILIIDEPTSQLDPEGMESVFKIIKTLKEKHKTIILVEHKVDLIAEYADEVFVFKDGQLIFSGNTQTILSDTALLNHKAALPQVALLGNLLKKRNFPISMIPITEVQAVEIISQALNRKVKNA